MPLRLTPCTPTAAITLYTSYHTTTEPDAPQ
jgi:5,10-methylene-tetrahydrofolate dehydrogenase/methenyl tetrahydrofolate cyclohydrolase